MSLIAAVDGVASAAEFHHVVEGRMAASKGTCGADGAVGVEFLADDVGGEGEGAAGVSSSQRPKRLAEKLIWVLTSFLQ